MQTQELSFTSSWRMLTRDKGWIKPVLVLTLVGWIPILGQIVLLGYGLEWARLTAWGVDAAPKQGGVDYGKVLSSGGRAFLVSLTLGFVIALVLQLVFPGSLAMFASGVFGLGALGDAVASAAGATLSLTASLVAAAIGALSGSFVQAATLRATLYDSFAAGWRLDRLFQMVGRDFGGFLRTFLVSLIGGIISGIYSFVVGMLGVLFLLGGIVSVGSFAAYADYYATDWTFILEHLLRVGAAPLLLFLLVALALAFIGGVIATAMNLVSINATGLWFRRFDVDRWGASEAPLPEGVPHKEGTWSGSAPVMPSEPSSVSGEAHAAPSDPSATSCATHVAPSAAPDAPHADSSVSTADAPAASYAQSTAPVNDPAVQPAAPASEPAVQMVSSVEESVSTSVGSDIDASASASDAAFGQAVAEAPSTPADDAPTVDAAGGADSTADASDDTDSTADAAGNDAVDDSPIVDAEATKKPIPLSPISLDEQTGEDDGPISV